MNNSVYQAAQQALMENDVARKCELTFALGESWKAGALGMEDGTIAESVPVPGRPVRPELVDPRQLKQRKLSTPEGRAIFVHALAHIEFNAINLALDAAYRFRDLPDQYYGDWIRVACEEATHFGWLEERLHQLDARYGDFPAHTGLWDMAVRTEDSVLKRMALVPRVFEARGLDVTPGMISRLEGNGDNETVVLLRKILADEIGHVEIGNRWYAHACAADGLEPESTFVDLVARYFPGQLRGKLNREARLAAGFSAQELDNLAANVYSG